MTSEMVLSNYSRCCRSHTSPSGIAEQHGYCRQPHENNHSTPPLGDASKEAEIALHTGVDMNISNANGAVCGGVPV